MKIMLNLQYIGDVEYDVLNKYQLFELYKSNDGMICNWDDLPFDDEYKEYCRGLRKISTDGKDEITVNIFESEENIQYKLNNACARYHALQMKNERLVEEYKNMKI